MIIQPLSCDPLFQREQHHWQLDGLLRLKSLQPTARSTMIPASEGLRRPPIRRTAPPEDADKGRWLSAEVGALGRVVINRKISTSV